MKLEKIQIGDKKVWPFTIPSGIVMTRVLCLERLAWEIPEIGILTTKSIGPEPREGNREPIFAQYAPGCFVNAVGLTNPGAEEFARELSQANIPKDKFLLASILGKNADEFVYVAKTLEDYVDGFELNLSCPHCEKVGMALGQDPKIVHEITGEVVSRTDKPVFAKLTPNAGDIGEIAKAVISAGARGLVAINTDGPGDHSAYGHIVLTNRVGGMSGRGIKPKGVRCVREIREAVGLEPLIIGIGGISTARDALEYFSGGANAVGIGSALIGMDDEKLGRYFHALIGDLRSNGLLNRASLFLQEVDMDYKKVSVQNNPRLNGCDLKTIVTDYSVEAKPGQFVFAWLPGIGEKPFSVMDDDPLTLGVLTRGEFTREINSLKKGDEFYIRGPYGKGVDVPRSRDVILVGGGCGIAGLYFPAKQLNKNNNIKVLLGAKDEEHLVYLEKFERFGNVCVATEDGSLGRKGMVIDLLRESSLRQDSYFLNCGPREMVKAVMPLELELSSPDRIYSSVDYMTRCGVGICGSCADEKGRRTCVEGPFMNSS